MVFRRQDDPHQGIWGFICLGTLFLAAPALLNGAPFLYFDSTAYLSRPQKAFDVIQTLFGTAEPSLAVTQGAEAGVAGNVIGGRSIFYGGLAWVSYLFGQLWPLVIVQSALTAGVLGILLLRVLDWSIWAAMGALIFMLLTTPLGVFTGLVMPDFLAPMTVLTLALLVFYRTRLNWAATSFVVAMLVFACLSHTSHLALATVLLVIFYVLRVFGSKATRGAICGKGLVLSAVAVIATVAAHQTERQMAKRVTGSGLLERPHLTAHLVDNGPGLTWIKAHCGAPETFAICGFSERLPVEWRDFLFRRDMQNGVFLAKDIDAQTQRALSQEDFSFALAVLRDAPGETLSFALRELIRQMGLVQISEVPLDAVDLAEWQNALPPDLLAVQEASAIFNDPRPLMVLSRTSEVTAAISVLVIIAISALIGGGAVTSPQSKLFWLVLTFLLGIVLNAAICGIAASPYPRFQARVTYLFPLAALILLHFVVLSHHRKSNLSPQ